MAEGEKRTAYIKKMLSNEFQMKEMGLVGHFLNLRIRRDRHAKTITLSQSHYTDKILRSFRISYSKPVRTPLPLAHLPESPSTGSEEIQLRYQRLIGSLMYAMVCTRPDISFSVNALSRHNSNPSLEHWIAAKRVLRYLNGTKDLALQRGTKHGNSFDLKLGRYSDSAWASNRDDRRSTLGLLFHLNGSTIVWQSKKQTNVALSTVESEYMTISQAVKEALWLRTILSGLGLRQENQTVISRDNQGCIALANHPTAHERSKHIEIKHDFIRDKLSSGSFTFEYVPTEFMIADTLTISVLADKMDTFIHEIFQNSTQSGQEGLLEDVHIRAA